MSAPAPCRSTILSPRLTAAASTAPPPASAAVTTWTSRASPVHAPPPPPPPLSLNHQRSQSRFQFRRRRENNNTPNIISFIKLEEGNWRSHYRKVKWQSIDFHLCGLKFLTIFLKRKSNNDRVLFQPRYCRFETPEIVDFIVGSLTPHLICWWNIKQE